MRETTDEDVKAAASYLGFLESLFKEESNTLESPEKVDFNKLEEILNEMILDDDKVKAPDACL